MSNALMNGPLVYVAGSYDTGNKGVNLQRAFAAAENVVKRGGFPIVPHMCHLWHSKFFYHKRDFWLNYTMRLLHLCAGHFMVICPGSEFSPGVAAERRVAVLLGITIYSYDEFLMIEKFAPVAIPALREVKDGQVDDTASQSESDDVRTDREQALSADVAEETASNSADIRNECAD